MARQWNGRSIRTQETGWVEEVPACLALPAYPTVDAQAMEAETLGEIPLRSHFTKVTTVEEATRNRLKTADEYLARHERGIRRALRELLIVDKEFGRDPRVFDAMVDVILADRFRPRTGGRPEGWSPDALLRRVQIARVMEGVHSCTGTRLEEVFGKMGGQRFEGLTYSGLKNYFYLVRRHAIERPHFFTREDQRRLVRSPRGAPPEGTFTVTGVSIEPAGLLPPGTRVRVRQERRQGHVRLNLRFDWN